MTYSALAMIYAKKIYRGDINNKTGLPWTLADINNATWRAEAENILNSGILGE